MIKPFAGVSFVESITIPFEEIRAGIVCESASRYGLKSGSKVYFHSKSLSKDINGKKNVFSKR